MKALTIKQPWAILIVEGYKEYEFRSWKTKYRGKIYIHAGLNKEKKYYDRFEDYELEYNYGAIIGEAEIVDCIFVDEEFKKELLEKNDNVYRGSDGYAWKLTNIKKYDKPIPCKGRLSLWNYEEEEEKVC